MSYSSANSQSNQAATQKAFVDAIKSTIGASFFFSE
jgi:hypothetical protein